MTNNGSFWDSIRMNNYCFGPPLVELVKDKFLEMARDGKEKVDKDIEYLEKEPGRVAEKKELILKQAEDEQLAADLISA